MEVKMIMQVSFKKYDWIDQNLIKVECLDSLLNLLFSTLLYQVGLLLTMDSWFSQMQLQFILCSPFGHQPQQCCPVMQWMTKNIQQFEELISLKNRYQEMKLLMLGPPDLYICKNWPLFISNLPSILNIV